MIDEYKSLQSLHLWRPISITPTSFSLSYDAEISLHLDCINSIPNISSARVERLPLNEGAKVGRAVGGIWRGYGDSPSVGLYTLFEAAVKELSTTHKGHISTVSLPRGKLIIVRSACRSNLVSSPKDKTGTTISTCSISYHLHLFYFIQRCDIQVDNDINVPFVEK
jgi:hypothetical protein